MQAIPMEKVIFPATNILIARPPFENAKALSDAVNDFSFVHVAIFKGPGASVGHLVLFPEPLVERLVFQFVSFLVRVEIVEHNSISFSDLRAKNIFFCYKTIIKP